MPFLLLAVYFHYYMYYKLSNTSDRERLERSFGAFFKHPKLYRPEVVINGHNESNLPIITSNEPSSINLGIWGILPEFYKDDWAKFQSLTNTLTIDERHIQGDLWYKESLEKRRCLILVTGYFTTFLKDGVTYPYHIGLKSGGPFCLAGMYNVLEDGFITFSLVVGRSSRYIRKFQNLVDCMPIAITENLIDFWLDQTVSLEEIQYFLSKPSEQKLHADPTAKEIFGQNISYDSMLERYEYEDLPTDE